MDRRTFLSLTGLGAVTLALPQAALAVGMDYTPGLVQEKLAAGETVYVTFGASWCSTCAAQDRVMKELKAANPDYEANITFVHVDWDAYGKSDLAKSLQIPRRSTLVVLKGDQELGRVVAQTGKAEIKALMDAALGAASA